MEVVFFPIHHTATRSSRPWYNSILAATPGAPPHVAAPRPPSSCWCRPHTVIAWPYHASHLDLPTATSSRTPDCPDCRLDPPRRSPEPPPGPITPVVVLLAPPTVTAPATDLQGRSVVLPSYSPYIIDRHSPELVSPPWLFILVDMQLCNGVVHGNVIVHSC
jgi:hypothetical protein